MIDIQFSDIHEYHKNPRRISAERFEHLSRSLGTLGDIGGIVLNRRTNEIIGGNQRTKSFLREREHYTIRLVKEYETPQNDGTVAYGFVVRDEDTPTEQCFSFRVVDWDEETAERANIQANKITGSWDYDVLANEFDLPALKEFGFSDMDLDLIPKPLPMGADENLDNALGEELQKFTMYLTADQLKLVKGVLARVKKENNFETETDAFMAIFDETN